MRFALGCTAVVVAIALGCGGSGRSAGPPPPETTTTGSLTVDWMIAGATEPSACDTADATAIEITVVNDANEPIGTFQESCSAFTTSIVLEEGIYAGDARLLDATGTPITRTLEIEQFTMNAKSQLMVPLNFPATAFVAIPR